MKLTELTKEQKELIAKINEKTKLNNQMCHHVVGDCCDLRDCFRILFFLTTKEITTLEQLDLFKKHLDELFPDQSIPKTLYIGNLTDEVFRRFVEKHIVTVESVLGNMNQQN